MQTLLAHSAFWRGLALFAGMLIRSKEKATPVREDELVSWCEGARSRREYELARSRQATSH